MVSRIAAMQPSSPHFPCSPLNATSGLRSARTSPIFRFTSMGVTLKPARRSASLQASPLARLTSRSADQPPMRTATWVNLGSRSGIAGALHRNADALDFPIEFDARCLLDPVPDRLAELLDLGGRRAAFVDQEIAVHFRY